MTSSEGGNEKAKVTAEQGKPAAAPPVFGDLPEAVDELHRFADAIERGEVGAEHLARVMAAIGGAA